jgi:hypothetical protein
MSRPTSDICFRNPSKHEATTERTDRGRKLHLYARHGIRYYWIVDPATRIIDAYALDAGVFHLAGRLTGDEPAILAPSTACRWTRPCFGRDGSVSFQRSDSAKGLAMITGLPLLYTHVMGSHGFPAWF